jgi:hypothetical protein
MDIKEFSRLGGKAGKGDAKRRDPDHYKKISAAGVAARLAKLKNKPANIERKATKNKSEK